MHKTQKEEVTMNITNNHKTQLIPPHGGTLKTSIADTESIEDLRKKAASFIPIHLDARQYSDLKMIGIGAYSPLSGFMSRIDYENVLKKKRLANGIPWSIPITLDIDPEKALLFEHDKWGTLYYEGKMAGMIQVEDIYSNNKEKEAELVYRTKDSDHPGVAYLQQKKSYLVGGSITYFGQETSSSFSSYRLTPSQTRDIFLQKGWKKVVGFQTRNPIHRAHEYIIKTAMEITDGLFLNPLIGETKKGDIPARVRMECYRILLNNYFPENRVVLGVYEAAMRYAGPREAIMHAIVRKNFGCSHFIVGRDHAGVGNYYGTYDAQKIFDEYEPDELGITPLMFDHSFWCKECGEMVTQKTCPHDSSHHVSLSGTKVRKMLAKGKILPPEISRHEVSRILSRWFQKAS